jgi:hypothetical protein
MPTIGTKIVDGEVELIKTDIPLDEPSVCIEDFCGYTNPGHFPISFAADYFPRLGFTRFTGAWWNVPDMESDHEPTEDEISAWAHLHVQI